MTEKTGYVKRTYRIYGHPCTRRRYIVESALAIVSAVAVGLFSYHVAGGCASTENHDVVLGIAAGLMWIYYRGKTLNVNGYENERPDDEDGIEKSVLKRIISA